jgi:hypothetical protein
MSSFVESEAVEAVVVHRRRQSSGPARNPDAIRRQSISQSKYLYLQYFSRIERDTAIA